MRAIIVALCVGLLAAPARAEVMVGIASVEFGRVTKFDGADYRGRVSTGERYKAAALAVAHRTLPLGLCVAVSYRKRTQVAVVNDRGPCLSDHCQRVAPARVKARVLDMTPAVAARLKFPGLGRVSFQPIDCVPST